MERKTERGGLVVLNILLGLLLFISGYTNHRTWFVGDSIIRDAGDDNPQIPGGGICVWSGIAGYRLYNLDARLRRMLIRDRNEYPSTIVIHLGTNDILKTPTADIRERVKKTLVLIRNLLPTVRIIWSDILPRLAYSEEKVPGAGKSSTININKYAHQICRLSLEGNSHFIKHSRVFNPRLRNVEGRGPIYRYDGVHLTAAGNLLLRQSFGEALTHFNSFPGDLCFPTE